MQPLAQDFRNYDLSMKFGVNEFSVFNIIINGFDILDPRFCVTSIFSFLLTDGDKFSNVVDR